MEKLIDYVNKHNTDNIVLLQSSPTIYLDTIRKKNITWATYYNDMFPYSEHQDEFWSGYYTTRPNTKKLVKDGSANLHAASKLFAQKVLKKQTTKQEVNQLTKATQGMYDAMGVFQHHDAITGTDAQFVDQDYVLKLWRAQRKNTAAYKVILEEALYKYTGIKANDADITNCLGQLNDTVA